MAFEDKYIASRYHVENQIGEGGMSVVYKAKDIVTGKDVAIKILKEDTLKNPTNIERFNREARATASLSHPNIVRVITVGTQNIITRSIGCNESTLLSSSLRTPKQCHTQRYQTTKCFLNSRWNNQIR